jgi:hypothetical protein
VYASYCSDDTNAERSACFASHPSYCSSTSYADRAACSGARPSYCGDARYASSKACSGPDKPSRSLVRDVARRMGSPVKVRDLAVELMK